MRIGFFGGSFDPPHLGHLAVARAAASAFWLDLVLFAPTARQPLKPDGAEASYRDRLAMVSLLCELQPASATPRFEPSTVDAPLPDGGPNYTVDTLARLHSEAPSAELFAIIGADAFRHLPSWRSPEMLLSVAEWVVVSRPGFALDQLTLSTAQREHVHLLEDVHELASATHIRSLLHAGYDCSGLLSAAILHYIRAHHLYRD